MKFKLNILAALSACMINNTLAITPMPNTGNITSSSQTDKTPLGQSHVSAGKTLTIGTPGNYYIATNLAFAPSATSAVMINITSDNVSLDLGNFAIYSNRASTSTVAINVAASKSNIQIYNGIIHNMTGTGIKINSGCRNVHIANMSIHNCDEGGIDASSSDHVYVSNCVINNCNGSTSTTAAAALRLTTCKNVYAANCEFSQNTGTSKAAVGALLSGCIGCEFSNCFANHNTGTAAYGFQLTSSCKDCLFEDCGAKTQTSSAGIASGFDLATSSSCRFINCYSNNNTAVGGMCHGFKADTTSNANTFTKCSAVSNTSDTAMHAFHIQSNGNQLEKCKANQNSATGGNATGYYIDGTGASSTGSSNVFKNCIANQNSASAGNASGFLLDTTRSNSFKLCTSTSNTTAAQNKYAAGFDSSGGTGNAFEDCTANSQYCSHATGGTNSSSATHFAAGFLLKASEKISRIINSSANCNDGGNGEGIGFGIYLRGNGDLTDIDDSTAPLKITVRDCRMEFNTSSGSSTNQTNKYGFFDEHRDTTAALINNISMGHGRCVSTLDTSLNFVDPFSSASLTNGMNFMFYHTGTDENPANMIHETDIFNWTTLSTSVPGWMNTSIVVEQVTTIDGGTTL
jgi:hypothetical protein